MIDRKLLGQFLALLLRGEPTSLVFQTFDDRKKKDSNLARTVRSSDANPIAALDKLSAQGAGICVQINAGEARGAKHITKVRAAFVDLDHASIEPVLTAVANGRIPPPHLVVCSSPGRHHVYWKCTDCALDQFSTLQTALAKAFDGDPAVHNLDRVMRLPGTLNRKHSADGHLVTITQYSPHAPVPAAELLDAATALCQVIPADPITMAGAARFAASTDAITNSLQMADYTRKETIDVLLPGDRTQKIIRLAGGLVAENPDASFETLKRMLVFAVEERTPEGVAGPTDDAWTHEIFPGLKRFIDRRDDEIKTLKAADTNLVLSSGDSVDEFEAYQAASNQEPMSLKEFSERYVLVSSEQTVYDLNKSPAQTPLSLSAFKVAASVHKAEGVSVATKWLKNRALRRTVDKTMYCPYAQTSDANKAMLHRFVRDKTTGEVCLNTYSPPVLKPVRAEAEITYRAIKPFLTHMKYMFPDDKKREIMLDWFAATVQRPERRVMWCPLIVTTYEGVGKGWLAQLLQQLVGWSNFKFITTDALDKAVTFNDFLAGSTVVVLDELKAGRREDIKVRLNAMITETMMEVNKKFGTKQLERIYCNFLAFSNYPDAVALTETDRRFFVHIFEERPQGADYYEKLVFWLERTKGPAILLDWLLARDISKFKWGECPRLADDKDKRKMMMSNRTDVEDIVYMLETDCSGPFTGGVTCLEFVYEWLTTRERMVIDKDIKLQVRHALKRLGANIGRVDGVPSQFRTRTYYVLRSRHDVADMNISSCVKEIKRNIDAVYGNTSIQLVRDNTGD